MSNFFDALEDDTFDEEPVDLKTFVEDEHYMGLPPMSDKQMELLEAMTQIYKPETIDDLYADTDPRYANYLKSLKIREVVAMIGKGGGKNHTTITAMCRVAYLLLCLKHPASYYGKPKGDSIHMLNVAVNSTQAKNTFFLPFKKRIENSPWFQGKFYAGRSGKIEFDKNITAYSGHSQREAWEGYNLIFVVLDEIAAFKTEAESTGMSSRADTAPEIYKMYKASIASRFPRYGKLCLLSFPRFAGDYITERFNDVVLETEVHEYEKEFLINPDRGDVPGNKLKIQWFEEEVITYEKPYVMAVRYPSWVFNPTFDMEDYVDQFNTDMQDSLSRFACNPPDAIDAFFTDSEKVREAFKEARHPFTDNWQFLPRFIGDKSERYYMHVDLAQKSDRAAVAISHVDRWVRVGSGPYTSVEPVITLDAVRWWTPTAGRNVDFTDIKEFILAVKRRGFSLKKVTFDRWAGSIGLQHELAREGIEVETLSVGREQYNDFQLAVYDGRMQGYNVPLLVDEILGLRVDEKGRVDHTAAGSNDLADAVAGSVHLCMKYEERPFGDEIEVHVLGDEDEEESLVSALLPKEEENERPSIEQNPSMPEEVELYLKDEYVL